MAKVAVVLRHLPNCRPAVSAVIADPEDSGIDNLEHYFQSRAEEHIRLFKKQFPEFEDAQFYTDIVDLI